MKQYSLSEEINSALEGLKAHNPDIAGSRGSDRDCETGSRAHRLQKVLVANRGEIAKRFFLALHEEGIPSVASVADPDRGQSWYEFADEVIFIGDSYHYASIPVVIAAALLSGANAVYSGYGFLSENAEFVRAIDSLRGSGEDIIFMGPDYETMRRVGSKIEARRLARDNGIPVLDSTGALSAGEPAALAREGAGIGYPLVLKLSSGAGGRGIFRVDGEAALIDAAEDAARLGRDLYGDATFYLERLIPDPVHFEVQIFNGRAIGIRKCAVQRRNQKIIEESGHAFLDDAID
jgi:acetyl/propionyl-CoA carboxylase alpha subunit